MVVDGFLPDAGGDAFSLLPEKLAVHYQTQAAEQGLGWLDPPSRLDQLGVTDPGIISAYTPRLVWQPLKTYSDIAGSPLASIQAGGTLLCTGWRTPFESAAARALSLGWRVHELTADHELPLTAPDLLARQLVTLA